MGNNFLRNPSFSSGWMTWLNNIFNKRDMERLREVGPDRAAAEWVIRNGGCVQFKNSVGWQQDMQMVNMLGRKSPLVAIDALGNSITESGLDHLMGLEHLHTVNFNGCRYLHTMYRLSE